jgi:L-cystine transport system permease protein
MADVLELWLSSLWPLLRGALTATIPLSIVSFAIALVLAALTAAARLSPVWPLRKVAELYVWVFRGTPLVVQLFIMFYGLPKLGIVLDAWTAGIVTLALNTGAYASEAIRASVLSIPRGQIEAAQTLGLSGGRMVRFVIAPQALRIALPPLANDFIDLVKGTSLVYTITIVDLFLVGQQIASATFQPLAIYVEVALVYLLIVTLLTLLQGRLETYASKYMRR